MKVIKSIVIALSSILLLPTLAWGKDNQDIQIGMAFMRLQTSLFSNGTSDALRGGSVWINLRRDFRMDEVNSALVRAHESKFAQNRAYFNRTIERSQPYLYHIANEVKKRGMPAEIALLPFIESAFVTNAKSHVGASGLWQFMPATGRHYGLEQTPLYDGRHDIFAATDAALNYLQYLYGLFGDWSLALAAYNWGEGNVSRAINRAISVGLPPTYENLRMPNETRNYVPKLLAVRNLVNNPQAFGLSLPEIKSEPYFKAVSVTTPLDIMAAAHLANISESELLRLNPAFKTPVFIPKDNRRMLLLPVHAVKTFETNYRESDPKTLLSWDIFTPNTRTALSDIAQKTGSSVNELKRLNGISGTHVNAGRSILVNKNSAGNITHFIDFTKADFDPVPDTYIEQASILGAGGLVAPPPVVPPTFVATIPQNSHSTTTNTVPTPAIDTVQTSTNTTPTTSVSISQENFTSDTTIVNHASNVATENDSVTPEVHQRAQEAIRSSLAQSEAEETQARIIAEKRTAEAVQKKQQLAEENNRKQQLAKAEETKKKQQLAQAEAAKKKQQLAQAEKAKMDALAKMQTGKHKVAQGETLYSIAKRYNMSVEDLAMGNNIKGNAIQQGQILRVTENNKTKTETVKTAAQKDKKKSAIPTSYTVKKGDTLEGIAERYHLRVTDLKRLNKGNSNIKVGQTLKLN